MGTSTADLAEVIERLQAVLVGDTRARIVDGVSRKDDPADRLRRLRSAMGAHRFQAGDSVVDLAKSVRRLDQRTRQDGFRVLHAWNHQSHRFTEDIVPVLLLDFFARAGAGGGDGRVSVEILLDYYFLNVLSLCATRVWDTPDPDDALGRLDGLVGALQGEDGSGHRFVADAETLLIHAISQFHPEEQAYERIIERVESLSPRHRTSFAATGAAVLSAHLRWGLWLMYGRDVVRMRSDNLGDYPWLLSSVLTLLRAWRSSSEAGEDAGARREVTQALLLGIAADPWLFKGKVPAVLADQADRHAEAVELLRGSARTLLEEFEALRPARDSYSPLSLHFNFPHNTLVAIVTLALLEGRPQPLPLNALFGGPSGGPPVDGREGLARTLMAFSRGSPDRLGHRGAMLVAYDPLSAMRSYSMTVEALRALL